LHIVAFLAAEEVERSTGATDAVVVGNDVHVTTRYEKVAGAGLDEAQRRTEILDLPWIRRGGDEHGVALGCNHIGEKRALVAHRHRHLRLSFMGSRWRATSGTFPAIAAVSKDGVVSKVGKMVQRYLDDCTRSARGSWPMSYFDTER
jgi:hypothetical protein